MHTYLGSCDAVSAVPGPIDPFSAALTGVHDVDRVAASFDIAALFSVAGNDISTVIGSAASSSSDRSESVFKPFVYVPSHSNLII